jgi:hypothetical protein
LPLPDSPLMTIHVSRPCCFISLWAASAIAKTCGGFSNNSLPAQTYIYTKGMTTILLYGISQAFIISITLNKLVFLVWSLRSTTVNTRTQTN